MPSKVEKKMDMGRSKGIPKKGLSSTKSRKSSKASVSDHDTKNAEKDNEGDELKVMQPKSKNTDLSASKKATGNTTARGALEATGETVCREVACEGLATSAGYCRLHYIKNWKKIKRKESILREKKLNQYIEELVAKYPDKYIEAIRQDLASDKDFAKVIYDLDLDEGLDDFDVEGGESVDSLIDSIRRDFDDEGETF